jgi:predicted transposase/invertase (TIGR01784 family)
MNNFNRNHKDSVFVDLFANDITAKENFVSLYNALHKTNLDPQTTEIKPVMLENILYMSYYNDISMLIDGKIVVLIEHQSTVNQNMPFRFLEYIARVYEKITSEEDRFGRKLIKLPIPEFYVFYNGTEDFPLEKELKLSDAFFNEKKIENKNFPLEITVKIININIEKDNPILHQCNTLKQYSDFINQVRICMKENVENPFTTAINLSIKNGILSDYLKRKSTEIRNMLFGEYDYDTDIRVQRREAFEDGVEEGAEQKAIETAKNLLSMSLSLEDISKATGLPLNQVEKLAQECKNQK